MHIAVRFYIQKADTVNRRKLVNREVVTSLMSIATGSVERGEYS